MYLVDMMGVNSTQYPIRKSIFTDAGLVLGQRLLTLAQHYTSICSALSNSTWA